MRKTIKIGKTVVMGIFFVCIFLFGLTLKTKPMTAYAASGLSYQVTKGECYITGRGTETGRTLVIPATINGDKVKGIKEMAFYNGTFTSVTIENGVEEIGKSAFGNCSKLTKITLPESIKKIGNDAFYNTAYVKNKSNWENNEAVYIGNYLIDTNAAEMGKTFEIKDGTTLIAEYAMFFSYNLKNLVVPESLKIIGDSAFGDCNNLDKVYYKYGEEVYENIIEPIIDEQTFYRAQEKLSENVHKAARSKAAEKFILSGKLICAECGELMVGESGTSKTGEIYTYYKCAAKKKSAQNCASKAVRKEVIEKAVYNAIIRALQDDNFIREVARKAVEIHNADIEESKELKILNRQKADIDKQLANITNAICQGIFNEFTQAKMIELSNTQKSLETQIANEQTKTVLPLKEARVVAFLKNYTEIVKCADKTDSLENMKRLFDVFIHEVIFDGERFLIVMKTTDEPLDPEERQKEKATRKKFELLRFGDPNGT